MPPLSELVAALRRFEQARRVIGFELLLPDEALQELTELVVRWGEQPDDYLVAAGRLLEKYRELLQAQDRRPRPWRHLLNLQPKAESGWLRATQNLRDGRFWVGLGSDGWRLGYRLTPDGREEADGGFELALMWMLGIAPDPVWVTDPHVSPLAVPNAVAYLALAKPPVADQQIIDMARGSGMELDLSVIWDRIDRGTFPEGKNTQWLTEVRNLRKGAPH